MISGRKPGRALDVGTGQGRNSIWLAERGWSVTGFDISPVAVEEARREASNRGLGIETQVIPYELFDWGANKWDLIVFSYFLPRSALPKVWEALRPGGLILVEGFHADTGRIRPIGGGYHDNELFRVLERYRILVYEDVEDRQEWGREFGATNRLVRVLAEKSLPLPPGCFETIRPVTSLCASPPMDGRFSRALSPDDTVTLGAGRWPGIWDFRSRRPISRLTAAREFLAFGPIATDANRSLLHMGSQDGRVVLRHNEGMVKSVEGVYRNGKVEVLEPIAEAEGSRVIVTWVQPAGLVDLRERGIDERQAADLRRRLTPFAEDWERPEMNAYDELPPR